MMKRHLLLFLATAMLLLPVAVKAQNIAQIGGTFTDNEQPTNFYFNYAMAQQVYRADYKNSSLSRFTLTECPAPTDLTVFNVGYNTAYLTWNQPEGGFGWYIQYSTEADFSSPVNEYTESTSFQLTNLDPITTYYVRVANDCILMGTSPWSETESFTTTGGVIILPDIIDFETGTLSEYPFDNDANYPWMIADASTGCDNGSTYCMRSGNAGVNNSTSSIEASYDFSEDGYIAFDAKCMGEADYYDVCKFYIDGAEQFSTAVAGWDQYSYPVSAGTHTFTWSYSKDGSVNNPGDGFFVDNIVFGLGVAQLCHEPIHLEVSNVGSNGAGLSWDQPGAGDQWIIQYSTSSNFSNPTEILSYNTDMYLLSLTPATTYYVRVANHCGAMNNSLWTELVSFTTEGSACPTPIGLTVSNVGYNTAYLTWNQPEGGFGWYIQYSTEADFSSPVNEYAESTSFQLTNLDPITTYYVRVANDCILMGTSDWSTPFTFTTETYSPPYFYITGDDSICPNQTTNLTVNTNLGNNYIWSNGAISGTITVPVGEYTVTVYNDYGEFMASGSFNVQERTTYNITVNDVVCDAELPYTWNGNTYTTSGNYPMTFTAANGCDSVVTLHLTVNQPVQNSVTATACGSYTWNGNTYTTSGNYPMTFNAANGCDSVVTLHLTVNTTYAVTDTRTICESELPYTWNSVTFIAAGTQSVTLTAANGCDSVVTMTLTVNPTYAVTDVRSVCPSELPYTWNGVVFNTAGTQNVTLQTVNGCDSVVTMILTVNQTQVTSDSRTICESELPYTWNGVTFSAAGMNTATLQDANGCDSTVIMTLIVNPSAISEFTIETSDSCYTWNGQTYCASGDYVQTLQTVNGCDSVVTLHLTTSVGVENYELSVVFLAPNPTQNICRIMGLETDPVSVELFDLHGKMVMRDDDTELDVSKLPTGMYMVRVNTSDRVINLKLIKQ